MEQLQNETHDFVYFKELCSFTKKRLQHRYFYVSFVNLLRTTISQNTCEQLLLKSFKIIFRGFTSNKFADLQSATLTKHELLHPLEVFFNDFAHF